ncbi:hypothetical protein [Brevibacillus dissolubilis]|uniref:hypothetical protein n=1 Tax=Brevibacillus dissolubilis TaxID=1844116 RepID=UPI00159BDF48|nr:hypothetical protein [Brevibacillus dissolubilis]
MRFMTRLRRFVKRFWSSDIEPGFIEYALLIALFLVSLFALLFVLGEPIGSFFDYLY